ncbi:hypothetical protein [Flammeovirga sp. EKP202]|uniref:hypothetical protein n=1 Tax=Flammeovirga sp. EKP202 TaxID=2770592 RepID=UPI00165FF7D5|nr:hypothetical protein [Flammeovirga sp. EKP202]MBD0401345.1 hypothetical protein [Flammeovirga sp. EKP202]
MDVFSQKHIKRDRELVNIFEKHFNINQPKDYGGIILDHNNGVNLVDEKNINCISLLKEINKKTFNEIWVFGRGYDFITNDSIYVLNINTKGDYLKMLDKLSEQDDLIKFYHKRVITNGYSTDDFIIYNFYKKNELFDDKRLTLNYKKIIAIHFISIICESYSNEEYKEILK